jgi:hypothetical protein
MDLRVRRGVCLTERRESAFQGGSPKGIHGLASPEPPCDLARLFTRVCGQVLSVL